MSSICDKSSDSLAHWDLVLPRQTTLYGVTMLLFATFLARFFSARLWGPTNANKLSRYAVKNGMAALTDIVLKNSLSCCTKQKGVCCSLRVFLFRVETYPEVSACIIYLSLYVEDIFHIEGSHLGSHVESPCHTIASVCAPQSGFCWKIICLCHHCQFALYIFYILHICAWRSLTQCNWPSMTI